MIVSDCESPKQHASKREIEEPGVVVGRVGGSEDGVDNVDLLDHSPKLVIIG